MSLKPELQVEKALAEAWAGLPAGGRVLLAVSGGVDSMVLLEAAARLAEKNFQSQRLLVVHVNHSLRGAESDGDESLVLGRAMALGLEARAFRLRWKEGEKASQDQCRRKREELFGSLWQGPADRVLLAHHLNDQAETVLLRLIRGTGARGLKGMLPAAGRKVRPFLGLEKLTLVAAANEWKITWRHDSSNDSLRYERNWVRSLFPLIEERRPGFQGKLAALAKEAGGWAFPAPALDFFALEEGISFARPEKNPGTAALREQYQLSRRHSEALQELLRKSHGQAEAEGVRFRWSAGVLLAEKKGARFHAALEKSEGSGWKSALGEWRLPESYRPAAGGGKKEFQALRVPIFFRPAVPLAPGPQGSLLAMLPRRLSSLDKVSYSPSPLARWWLMAGPGR